MFKTNRGLLKYLIFTLITFGIYPLVLMSHISEEINIVATPRDGKHTMHYLLIAFIFSWLTFGIAPIVWSHRITNRIGAELSARNCNYDFGAGDFWLWAILGSVIVVGPFIFTHKLLKSMNLVNADYLAKRGTVA